MNYYFLAAYLPEISSDDGKIKLSLDELLGEKASIDPADWFEIELIMLGQDVMVLQNILSGFGAEVPYSVHGVDFWKEQVKNPREGPEFILEFLENRDGGVSAPHDLDRLIEAYYSYVLDTSRNEFLKSYFQFELDLKNIIAAWRARQKDFPPGEHVIGDNDITRALSRSNAEDFGLGSEYPWIEKIIGASDPLQLQTAVEMVLWDFLVSESDSEFAFSFSVILAYMLRLKILEKRLGLDSEAGVDIVRQLEGE